MTSNYPVRRLTVEPPPSDAEPVEVEARELPKLWEQQPWETPTGYTRFVDYYLAQEPPRSLVEAYRRHRFKKGSTSDQQGIKVAPRAWQNWAYGRNNKGIPIPGSMSWAQRAAAYDQYLRTLAFLGEQQEWEKRRRDVREKEYEAGAKLYERANRMLAALLFEHVEENRRVSDDGKTIIETHIYKPADWAERDIAAAYKIATQLMRAATDLPVNKPADVSWRDELAQLAPNVDPDEFIQLFAETLAQFAAGQL